jgi:hypothetical protein
MVKTRLPLELTLIEARFAGWFRGIVLTEAIGILDHVEGANALAVGQNLSQAAAHNPPGELV